MPVLSIAQQTIRVDVEFYDEAERKKLLRYPTAQVIQQLVAKPLDVPTAEFLAYFLFHRKRSGAPSFSDPAYIGLKLEAAIAWLDGCIDFNGHSICTSFGVARQMVDVSEHVGEAIGLSVVSRIHNLTEADWHPIDQQRGRGAAPTFDFQLASDGHGFIQVENKGSSVVDNRELDGTIKAQKRKIVDKKLRLNELAKDFADPYPASLRYGTITAVDPRRDGNVRCWLTDPPPGQIEEDPRSFRLLQRLRFLRDWISSISVRSQIAAALHTRVASLEVMRDPFELDRVPLRRGNGDPFEFAPAQMFGVHSTFLANKSRISDGPAGGMVVQLSSRALFLLGIREELLTLASDQGFEAIGNYQRKPATLEKTVECVFSRSRFRRLRLPGSIRDRARESAGYFILEMRGLIHYSRAGLVFGLLELPSE